MSNSINLDDMSENGKTIGGYLSSVARGGLELTVVRFLSWMKESGWKTILYADPGGPAFFRGQESGLIVRAVHSRFKYGDPVNARRFGRLARQDELDALIINQSHDIAMNVVARFFSGSDYRLIFAQHMHIGDKRDWWHRRQYRHLAAWVAPLELLAEQARTRTIIPHDRIHVIPNGIVRDQFRTDRPERADARAGLDLP